MLTIRVRTPEDNPVVGFIQTDATEGVIEGTTPVIQFGSNVIARLEEMADGGKTSPQFRRPPRETWRRRAVLGDLTLTTNLEVDPDELKVIEAALDEYRGTHGGDNPTLNELVREVKRQVAVLEQGVRYITQLQEGPIDISTSPQTLLENEDEEQEGGDENEAGEEELVQPD